MMATKKNMSFLWFPIMIKMMRMLDTHTKSVSPNSTNMIFLETIMVMLPLRSYKADEFAVGNNGIYNIFIYSLLDGTLAKTITTNFMI